MSIQIRKDSEYLKKSNDELSKQPRFGVLRPPGKFSGKIEGQNINYEDLWKHDQYVHDVQFKSPQDKFPDEDENQISPTRNLVLKFEAVKKAKKYTCCFCGFMDMKYIEIHHLDGNHFNNADKNLETACILCHRQHHLLWLSLCDHAELGAANVDYLPQAELNHLQRISFVLADHPTRSIDLGMNGKLGAMISMISNNFSRPLHAFMVSEEEKQEFRENYIASRDVVSPFVNKGMNYKTLLSAFNALDVRKHTQKEITVLELLDSFLPPPEQNVKPEEHRAKYHSQLKECIETYEKDITIAFEKEFDGKREVFSIFELAIALKEIDYQAYKEFNPPFLKLIYKPTIFTKEQIDYYKRLGYFNTTKWRMFTDGITAVQDSVKPEVSADNGSK